VQELVNNIIKHAQATEALVQVTQHQHLLTITVEDNGVGFEQPSHLHKGIGLKSLEERIRSLNGQLTITAIPGHGTTVYIEFNTSATQPIQLQAVF
jgi:signal transduction histidine kinase